MKATWWWLSFADTTRPEGTQWLGVAIVEAPAIDAASIGAAQLLRALAGHPDPFGPMAESDASMILAVVRSHDLGINPGGQVASWMWPEDEPLPAPELLNRLLSKDELVAAGLYAGTLADLEKEEG